MTLKPLAPTVRDENDDRNVMCTLIDSAILVSA